MRYKSRQSVGSRGLTLLEMVISMAILAIIFAIVIPQLRSISNSWDAKAARSEIRQNGRVLMDHFQRNLSTARRITSVTEIGETFGHIEFEDNDANSVRYDALAGDPRYIKFGTPGNLSDLAGPVSQFQLSCYDIADMSNPMNPVTDPNLIRFVKVEATFTNASAMGSDLTLTTSAFLRNDYVTADENDPNLLFVSGGYTMIQFPSGEPIVSPTAQERLRISLIQSWGYTVNLISYAETQATFDAAVAENNVIYVSQEALASSLGTKLVSATIGIVNENKDMIDEFGFAKSLSMGGGLPTLNIDTSHYITSVFATNTIAPYIANDWYQIVNEPVDSGVQAVGTWAEAPWTDKPALMVLSQGDAAGRRVQIPWGSGQGATPVALDSLSADAKIIMQRSIEWACGTITPRQLLFVVTDSTNPTSDESLRRILMESWGHTVTLIEDDVSQATFDAAVAANEVIYVSMDITNLSVGDKLRNANIGVVNEEFELTDDLGISDGRGNGFYTTMDLVNNTHFITSSFDLGDLALYDPAYGVYTGAAYTMAPDLQILGECGTMNVLVALETGGSLFDSGTAAARRVQVPWGANFSALNADGQTIMNRAIEWAAVGISGGGGGGGGDQEIYVNDIAMSFRKQGQKYFGQATVWIKDDGGVDMAGATVTGNWSGAVSEPDSGVTEADGKIMLESSSVQGGGTYTFTVTDVVLSDYTYNSSLNVETSDSITAP